MKLENQACSLEQAKKLKALGVAQESLCQWFAEHRSGATHHVITMHQGGPSSVSGPCDYAAYTVAELGEMLPDIDLSIGKDGD